MHLRQNLDFFAAITETMTFYQKPCFWDISSHRKLKPANPTIFYFYSFGHFESIFAAGNLNIHQHILL
jgi:hypothetical protein